jgi:heat shock protein HtpX
MSSSTLNIPQRQSLRLFVALAIFMGFLSYLFTLLLAAACVYLPLLAVGPDPDFPALALLVGGVVVATTMLWSLVPRRAKFQAPGLLLQPANHPRLFAEISNLAESLHEPVPSEVYLIGAANAWVADRGGLLGFGDRRVMALGLPLLGALNVSQFRAVLAHEMAHYYGGDTSLGPWLYGAQTAMVRTFRGIGSVRGFRLPLLIALMFSVVFNVLKWYWEMFLRAINFISRRQEFRADELACILTCPTALTGGLRLLHAADKAWPPYWQNEVLPLLRAGVLPPIANGFTQFLRVPSIAKQVQASVEKEMVEGKTKPYDSHPPLRERVQAAETLAIPAQPDDSETAYSLLNNLSDEELRFLEFSYPDLQKNSLRRVPWEERGSKVLIPAWERWVKEYASLLQGITCEGLPDGLGLVPEIAEKIRDPQGKLLTPEQRVPRARTLLASALGLALVNRGWSVHWQPGEFHLTRADEHVHPLALILQLSDGAISREAWAAKCKDFGIDRLSLVTLDQEAREALQ